MTKRPAIVGACIAAVLYVIMVVARVSLRPGRTRLATIAVIVGMVPARTLICLVVIAAR